MKCPANCPCCLRHELAIQSLQQQMLNEVNSYRKLLQMPSLTSIDSSFVTLLKAPVSNTVCPSIDTVSSILAMPSKRTLESMPPEILDRIASFVRNGHNILKLSHAVRYYKYISKAMFDTYSNILYKHGGYASIDDSAGMQAILGALPEIFEVVVNHPQLPADTDDFLDAICTTKRVLSKLSFGIDYFEGYENDSSSVELLAEWLGTVPIYELQFWSFSNIPMRLLRELHNSPMLGSLHLPCLEDCAGVALSECKSLTKLSISEVFADEESPEEVVEQILNIVKGTSIKRLELSVQRDEEEELTSNVKNAVTALFFKHGWHEQAGRREPATDQFQFYFACTR
ncbi:hypothetical protein HDU77_009440 [Chytriomyces hyalinus]|nr:hypothetical protein HDU77_009440 [Chytriomyces hyalinus]